MSEIVERVAALAGENPSQEVLRSIVATFSPATRQKVTMFAFPQQENRSPQLFQKQKSPLHLQESPPLYRRGTSLTISPLRLENEQLKKKHDQSMNEIDLIQAQNEELVEQLQQTKAELANAMQRLRQVELEQSLQDTFGAERDSCLEGLQGKITSLQQTLMEQSTNRHLAEQRARCAEEELCDSEGRLCALQAEIKNLREQRKLSKDQSETTETLHAEEIALWQERCDAQVLVNQELEATVRELLAANRLGTVGKLLNIDCNTHENLGEIVGKNCVQGVKEASLADEMAEILPTIAVQDVVNPHLTLIKPVLQRRTRPQALTSIIFAIMWALLGAIITMIVIHTQQQSMPHGEGGWNRLH